jgi:serine/threonine-protein kinase
VEKIGRYQIVRELGRGAMGLVYHAVDPAIGRPVAIKTIRLTDLLQAEERGKLRERLFREARAAGILSHPNIVTIYDMAAEDEITYIAMEFVDGVSLEQLMAEGRPLDVPAALNILRQTAAALDYAHSKGIVHRDVKPANVLIAGDAVKVTDFGIAKATAADQFTMTGAIVGTPNYMSPEQVQGLTVDGRADQFSLAVMAYELFTGEKPFSGEHLTTVVYKIVAEEPPPPFRLNATIGIRADSVIRKALGKKPEARFATCAEFVSALESACDTARSLRLAPRGASSTLPTVVEAVPPAPAPPAFARAEAPASRRPSALPLFAALLVAGGLIGMIAWQASPERKSEATPPPQQTQPEKKPNPMAPPESPPPQPPAATEEQPAEPEPQPPPAPQPRQRPAVEQTVQIASNPPGATAVLDRDPARSCQTPCALEALPGRHTISIKLAGHQEERREVVVGGSAQELPLISLRPFGGTLMLSSTPAGATVSINGRLRPETTPARFQLAPGSYSVTVEKDGMRKTVQVEIRNGVTKYQPVELGT